MDAMFEYEKLSSELAKQFEMLPFERFTRKLEHQYEGKDCKLMKVAYRSKDAIRAIAKAVPNIWGGSASLSGSNNTTLLMKLNSNLDLL